MFVSFIIIVIFIYFVIHSKNENRNKKSGENSYQTNYEDNSAEISQGITVSFQNIDSEVTPIEERIKTAVPDKYGLYPHEILAIKYAPTYSVGENNFQGFWGGTNTVLKMWARCLIRF